MLDKNIIYLLSKNSAPLSSVRYGV